MHQQVSYLQEQDPHHQHQHGLQHLSDGHVMNHNDLGGGGAGESVGTDVSADPAGNSVVAQASNDNFHNNNNQLTHSFQGQVYVFDSVSPEKSGFFLIIFCCH